MVQSVFANDRAFVDFYPNPSGSADKLVFTFSPLDRIGAERNARGFAVQFLLKNGYDVVAFTTGRALWYQDFSTDAIDAVASFVAALGPRHRVRAGYGMSMGATAAIAFSRRLKLDRVIAFSPQFTVNAPWDPRWAPLAEPDLKFSISPDQISDKAEFFFVYDAFDVCDALQVEEFRKVIAPNRLRRLTIDHTGHMTGFCLQQARVLGPLVLTVLDEGVFPDTRASFRAARRTSAMYLVHLAARLARRRRQRCAIAALDEALAIYLGEDPGTANWASDCVGVYLDKSKYLAELGRIEEAQACCDLAVARGRAREPERLPFALNQRASYFAAAGDFAAALRAQDEAVALRPDFAAFHGYRAASLLALGRPDESIAAARRQVDLAAADAGAHYSLAHALSAGGRHAEALAPLKRAVEIAPDSLTYMRALANLLRFLGQPGEAAQTLRAILSEDTDDLASRADLSRALFEAGRRDEALAEIDAVIARQPRVADHHAHRSVVFYHLGRHRDAVRSAREALACDPQNARLQAAVDHMALATGLDAA